MNIIYKTLIFGSIILVFDIPWILFYMKNQYKILFNKLKLPFRSNAVPAIIAYIIMILSYPLLINNQQNESRNDLIKKSASLGLVIYGTYGFTLSVFLPKYNLLFALKETLWGTLLFTIATIITYEIYTNI